MFVTSAKMETPFLADIFHAWFQISIWVWKLEWNSVTHFELGKDGNNSLLILAKLLISFPNHEKLNNCWLLHPEKD